MEVVSSINRRLPKQTFLTILNNFFTRPSVILPQTPSKFYKFALGQSVRILLPATVRKTIGFKFSLGYGTLSADQGTVISRRLTKTRRGVTPFYGVKIKNKVSQKFLFTKQ
jgi:hypothetical protein